MKIWPTTLIAALTAFYAIQRLPYAMYGWVHWIVFACAGYATYRLSQAKHVGPAIVCAFAAFAFNPILPMHFRRSQWEQTDVCVGIALLAVSFWSYKIERKSDDKTDAGDAH